MHVQQNKFLNFIENNIQKLLWTFIILYIIILSAICILKYNNFLYNALDLAIINNVFYNTLHGNAFWSSIQGHSYIGDHFTPILFLLLPFYSIYQSPLTLLILQTVFLALTAWPIYKISLFILKKEKKILALLLSLVWLVNPLTHNVNLHEFHFISLLPFFFLWTFYVYLKLESDQNTQILRFLRFFISFFVCLAIREDVVFIMLIFAIIIFIKQLLYRRKKTIPLLSDSRLIWLTLPLLSTAYYFFSLQLIASYSPSNFSPFLYYYSWMNSANFILVLKHIATIANFEMILGLLLPFLCLPLLKPKYLLLCLVPCAQITLSASGGGALVWQTHYSALFLPGLIVSFIYGFKKLQAAIYKNLQSEYLLVVLLVFANLLTLFTLGPWNGIKKIYNPSALEIKKTINTIPDDAAILASYDFLPKLSSRGQIYAMHYYFLGQQQFSAEAYIMEAEPEYVIINFDDLISYDVHLSHLTWAKPNYDRGYERLTGLLKNYGIVRVVGNSAVLKKNYASAIKLYTINSQPTTNDKQLTNLLADRIALTEYHTTTKAVENGEVLITLSFQSLSRQQDNYHLKVEFSDSSIILPLAYTYPTSHWQPDEIISANYWVPIEKDPQLENPEIHISLVKLYGGVEIDALRNTKLVIDKAMQIGEKIKLN